MKGKVVYAAHVKGVTIQEQVYLVIKLTDEGLSLKVVLYIKKKTLGATTPRVFDCNY